MKKQSPRAGSSTGSAPIPVRHQFDHVVPTVIHHPEEQMTALGRLVTHILQDRKKFSTWALSLLSRHTGGGGHLESHDRPKHQ